MQPTQPKLHFIGTYSVKQTTSPQTLARKKKEYFFVFRCIVDGATMFVLQELNDAYIPTGNVNTADPSILAEYFVHEPNVLAMPISKPEVSPQKLKHPRQAPTGFSLKEPTPAPTPKVETKEMRQARIRVAEEALRENFDTAFQELNLTNKHNKALRTIKKIANQEGIEPEHKHMFRDFTVSLRKKNLPEIALLFAERNIKLAPNDDHALFNASRIYAMLERFDEAKRVLEKAMTLHITPEDQFIYQKMLNYVESKRRRRLPPRPKNQA